MSILLFHNGLAAASVLALIAGVMLLRLAHTIASDRAVTYAGRHHEDTIEMHLQPSGWMPPVGARRISALLGDTQRIDPSRLEVSE